MENELLKEAIDNDEEKRCRESYYNSPAFIKDRDIIKVLLEKNVQYSIDEVTAILSKYNGKVVK